jgi:hypothetical protein
MFKLTLSMGTYCCEVPKYGADAGAGAQASRLLPSDGNSEVIIGSSGNKRACSDGRTDSPIEGCARRDSDFGSDPPAFIKVQGTHNF